MIMDIASQQRPEISIATQNDNRSKNDYNSSSTKTTLKRSFDVAFLMMPDDRLKQKQFQIEKQARIDESMEKHYPTDLSPRQSSGNHQQQHSQHHQHQHHHHQHQNQNHNQQQQQQQQNIQNLNENSVNSEFFNNNEARRYPQITVRSPRIYDDPTIILDANDNNPKSAFTKVARQESPVPPPPLSPDQLSCPSMSPPISTTPPRSNVNNIYQNFRPEYQFNGAFQSVGHVQALAAQNHRIKQHLMYRPINQNSISPELMPNYLPAGGFPFVNPAHHFGTQQEIPGIVRNPAAAAILTTLIPPTIASTFTLTAQNICAKCNISFRMTSDLVYHMRSHHKSEVACDPSRRKREEKLKCPVCNESFRERHHLTRHMTAHQDKASDQAEKHTTIGGNSSDTSHHSIRRQK